MLPLYFILSKDKKFYLYVFSPLCALLVYTFCYNQDTHYLYFADYFGFLSGGLLLAFTGISFGSISWLISQKLKHCKRIAQKMIATIFEIGFYFLIFSVWFSPDCDADTAYSVMLLMPIALGITFSIASFVSHLFRFRFLKYVAPVSLAIYLNHSAAWRIVCALFLDKSYKVCVILMLSLTVAISVAYFILLVLLRWVWRRVAPFFSSACSAMHE